LLEQAHQQRVSQRAGGSQARTVCSRRGQQQRVRGRGR
jgi:hypothetical protein